MSATVHIALGSNRRHGRHGAPVAIVAAAVAAIAAEGVAVVAESRVFSTKPMGPSNRAFANAVIAVRTDLPLATLLMMLKAIEARFGRRRGRRWGPRVLDLDIIAAGDRVTPSPHRWRHARTGLVVPHQGLAERAFVLDPLTEIAPLWRHPVLHLHARQLRARLRRPKPSAAGSP